MPLLPGAVLLFLSLAALGAGCASPVVATRQVAAFQTGTPHGTLQVVIRFRTVADPSTPAFIEELSRDAHAPLFYIRPMSGGAHVFGIIVNRGSLAEILRRLRARHDIEYVEQDRIMRPAAD